MPAYCPWCPPMCSTKSPDFTLSKKNCSCRASLWVVTFGAFKYDNWMGRVTGRQRQLVRSVLDEFALASIQQLFDGHDTGLAHRPPMIFLMTFTISFLLNRGTFRPARCRSSITSTVGPRNSLLKTPSS